MFMAAGLIAGALGHDRIAGLSGIGKALPMTVVAFGLAGLSLMGVPPSGGFLAKWLLLTASAGRANGGGPWSFWRRARGRLRLSGCCQAMARGTSPFAHSVAKPRGRRAGACNLARSCSAFCRCTLGALLHRPRSTALGGLSPWTVAQDAARRGAGAFRCHAARLPRRAFQRAGLPAFLAGARSGACGRALCDRGSRAGPAKAFSAERFALDVLARCSSGPRHCSGWPPASTRRPICGASRTAGALRLGGCSALIGNLGVFIAADVASFYLFFAMGSLSAYGLIMHDGTSRARRAGAVYMASRCSAKP